jgi:hypothetical protein
MFFRGVATRKFAYKLTFNLFKNIFTDCPKVAGDHIEVDEDNFEFGFNACMWYISSFFSILIFSKNPRRGGGGRMHAGTHGECGLWWCTP